MARVDVRNFLRRYVTDRRSLSFEIKSMSLRIQILRDDEAYLNAVLPNGREVVEYVQHVKGSLDNPVTKQKLEAKFIDQADEVMGLERRHEIMNRCWELGNLTDASHLLQLCSTTEC